MTRDNDIDLEALLQATIDAYGGSPDRWPPARRRQLAAYVDTNPDAARLIGEARALDRLLDASASAAPRDIPLHLVTDIMARATGPAAVRAEPRGSAQVVRFEPTNGAAKAGAQSHASSRTSHTGYWQAAAMLAASLLLGVFIGGTGQLNTTVAQLDAYLGASTTTEIASLLPNPFAGDGEYAGEDPL